MRELENRLMKHIDLLVERYPSLETAKEDIIINTPNVMRKTLIIFIFSVLSSFLLYSAIFIAVSFVSCSTFSLFGKILSHSVVSFRLSMIIYQSILSFISSSFSDTIISFLFSYSLMEYFHVII